MFSVVSRWSHVWRVSSYAAKWSWPLVSLKSVHLSSATDGNWWLQRLDLSLAKVGQNQSWQQWENLEGGITRTMPCWICLRKHGKHIKFPNFPKNVSQCVSATKSSSNWVCVQFILLFFPKFFSSSVSSVSSVEAKSEAQGILTNDVSLARFIAEIAFVYTNRAEWCAVSRGSYGFVVFFTVWPPVASSGLQVLSFLHVCPWLMECASTEQLHLRFFSATSRGFLSTSLSPKRDFPRVLTSLMHTLCWLSTVFLIFQDLFTSIY